MTKYALYIAIFLFTSMEVLSQKSNKQSLSRLDSLTRVMEQKKRTLGILLDDFYRYSKELEKQKDSSIKGTTISQRLTSITKESKSRPTNTKPANTTRASLENTSVKINKTLEEFEQLKKQWLDTKDSIGKMNETEMQMLQQMMEKKNQLETMISNTMKASYEGGQAAVQALKAS